jgi:hypothetical protein
MALPRRNYVEFNVEVTGAARLYRAASGGPQGYAASARKLPSHVAKKPQ